MVEPRRKSRLLRVRLLRSGSSASGATWPEGSAVDGREPAFADGRGVGPVIADVEVGVRLGQVGDRAIERILGAQIGRDRDGVPAPGVGSGQDPGAQTTVVGETPGVDRAEIE